MTYTAQQAKARKAALDLLESLPDKAAKVQARGNAGKGIIATKVADDLVMNNQAHYGADHRLYIGVPSDWEYPEGEGTAHLGEPEGGVIDVNTDQAEATGDALVADAVNNDPAPKTNGRKAKAEASPYSTATPTNRIKRHGKSRRTGTMTEIEDGLAKGSTFKVEGSGRYAVRCLTHKAETFVPDMTTAKPLQARTDQFCQKCEALVKAGDKYTDEAKAS
jgi:hypothetical protein